MKNLVMLIALIGCTLAPAAFADEDTSVSVEFIWGIGGSTSHKGFALRAGRDNAEVHLAHWFGARSNTALGVGLTARSENDGQRSNEFYHVSGTVGLAYVFQTNSVLSDHLQPYLRAAFGNDLGSDGDVELELSYSRYGFESAESFAGVGLRFNDRYNDAPTNNTKSSKPEDGDDDDDDDSDGDDDGDSDCTENCDDDDGDSDDDDSDGGDDCTENCGGDDDDDSDGDDDGDSDGDSDDDGNNGHGDDDDGCDESNPSGCGGSDDDDDDGNNGHGNDDDGDDDSNPGNGDNDEDGDGNNGHGNDDDGDDDSNPGNGGDDDDSDGDSDDDGNNGHGNDEDGCDNSNPGNGGPPSCG